MIKISVIIPAHNEENYIEKTLKSLKSQTLSKNEYEIIVCNDASSDKTGEIAKKYTKKVINLKKCDSISQVRNSGAKIAKGNLLLFIDADTTVNKDLLEKTLKVNEPCGLAKEVFIGDLDLKLLNDFNDFLIMYFPEMSVNMGCCMFFNKKLFNFFEGFNEELKTNEDNDLFKRLIKNGFKIGLIDSKIWTSDRRIKAKGLIKYLEKEFKNYMKFILKKKNYNDYEFLK
jgi:glycosyltransferase involved in cell wall biosynthesis